MKRIFGIYTQNTMSENKRNRKSNQNKQEPKRPIILAKKTNKDDNKLTVEKPRILLKQKDTADATRNAGSSSAAAATTAAPTQISIAARPIESGSSANDQSKVNRLQATSNVGTRDGKESHHSSATGEAAIAAASAPTATASAASTGEYRLPKMKASIPIISDHYQIQNHVQDQLIETNTDFLVIGIIGTQGAGKSFILNMLIDGDDDATAATAQSNDTEQVMRLLAGRSGTFAMRQSKQQSTLSNMPTTEGINMYITRHRTILLDCSPILCNPYKKEAIFNELDDLKMVIFLLSVCNTLIVIEDCGFNVHLMRLLMMAENMKVDVYDMDLTMEHRRYTPNILIFKNKCRNCDFSIESKQRTSNLYRAFFVCSGLKMSSAHRKLNGNSTHAAGSGGAGGNCDDDVPDIFYFPWIDAEKKNHYQAHPDLEILLAEFRQRVFMAPRHPFPLPNQQTTACTEKNWFHLALAVWETHKTSYFLRKFETLKEKEWALRV